MNLQNVQCKPRGAGGKGGGVPEEVKMLVTFFRVGTTDKFNKCS